MKEIIAIVNRRGGCGKTSTAHAIGAGLAHKGFKVLFVDMDSQANLTYDEGRTAKGATTLEVLTGHATAEEAAMKCNNGYIIPASDSLAGADVIITGTGKEYKLKEALEPLKDKFDYIIIDTPPALGTLTANALTAANSVIIPAQAEIHSLQGIGLLNETITAVKKYCNPSLTIKGILLTRYNGRAIISKDMKDNLEAIAQQLNTKLFPVPIRECTAVKEAQATRLDIFTYAPNSNAAQDYEELLKEITK